MEGLSLCLLIMVIFFFCGSSFKTEYIKLKIKIPSFISIVMQASQYEEIIPRNRCFFNIFMIA